jgi:hypothetical protein
MASKNRSYNVYRIVNTTPGTKKNKKYYIISSISDPEKLKTIIKGMKHSSTAKGGIKAVANDMTSLGKDYRESFTVKALVKGTSKERATQIRNSLKSKTPPAKTYNEPRS